MKRVGGMTVKYAELVNACLGCSEARILQETPTFISIGGKYRKHNLTLDYAFWIQHTFNNKLIIKCVLKGFNMSQRVYRQWQFPQRLSQLIMIESMQSIFNEFKPAPLTSDDSKEELWLCHRYKDLISRLKMDDANNSTLYTITVVHNCIDCYEFYLNMKIGRYKYTITRNLGKLNVLLESTTFINGCWEFPLNMNQSAMADKIEADINAMVMKL